MQQEQEGAQKQGEILVHSKQPSWAPNETQHAWRIFRKAGTSGFQCIHSFMQWPKLLRIDHSTLGAPWGECMCVRFFVSVVDGARPETNWLA